MFCKIANKLDMGNFWLDVDEVFSDVPESGKDVIYDAMNQLVNILCDSYCERRNPETIGGTVMVFYGKCDMEQRKNVQEYYHLSEEEHELRDVLTQTDGGYEWVSELYGGTDYNIVLIYRREP